MMSNAANSFDILATGLSYVIPTELFWWYNKNNFESVSS